jgi:hypothetical protein
VRMLVAADRAHLNTWKWRALAAGLISLAVALAASPGNLAPFVQAYLPPYLFSLGLALGSLALLMIYHLTGGAWGFLIRRILEAGTRTLPLLALLFLPIAGNVQELYPWAQWASGAGDHAQRHVQPYLNANWFCARAAAYFAVWLAVSFAIDRTARQQDSGGNGHLNERLRTLSGVGLSAYGVSLNFASVDWIMSLQFPFHSTIIGPLMASGHLLTALAFSILVLDCLSARPPLARVISPDAVNDLGSLLFAFVVVWSYMVWFQFMLIWIANLPTDVIFYVPRSEGGWQWVAWTLFVLAFLAPLLLLLLRKVKRNSVALGRVSAPILATQLVYDFYLVAPSYSQSTAGGGWLMFVVPIGVCGLWLSCFLWQFGRLAVLPQYDFNQNEALRLRHKNEHEALLEEEWVHG